MKTHALAALILSAFLLGLTTASAQAQTGEAKSIDDVLKVVPQPLNVLKPEQFSKIAQHPKAAYQASATLLGQTATIYLYWPDPKNLGEPVIAAVLPNVLTADKLFSVGSALDVGLNKPVLFWVKNEGTLAKAGMPADLQRHVDTIGMPGTVLTAQGFNLFGQLASGFVGTVLNAAPFNLNPNNLFAGAAKGKGGYAVSLSIGANTAWNNPFGLADTKIKGGTVRVTGDNKGKKTVEAWGTASLKSSKDYTVYLQRDVGDPGQTIGFDLKEASLADYFVVLGVVGKTLGLPAIPVPTQLPLNMVMLENPAYQAYTDASAPLNFDTMMFKGKLEKSAEGELITNARGKVFGQQVAALKINASSKGVKGEAEVAAKLGPLNAASAKFYLDVGLSGTPAMGIKASTLLGSADFKASTAGLVLDIPPNCPVQPLGIKTTVTDISPVNLPIKFQFKDCATQLVKDGVDAVVEGGKLVYKGAGTATGAVGGAVGAVGGAAVGAGKAVGGAALSVGKGAADTGKKFGKSLGF